MKRIIAVALACLITVPGIAVASHGTLAQSRHTASSSVAGPTFAFPVNGTAYPSNGPYVFQVQPVNGAVGYLWSFVQDGLIAYQNLAWDGHLSPASFTISTGSKVHSLIHSGDLHVWVRALMKDGTWSATGAVLVRIQGKGRQPQPRPTVAPQPKPSNVLYQADWSKGMNGWAGAGWKWVAGQLVSDGSNGAPILAPYQPNTSNYAVEVSAQFDSSCGNYFTLVARLTQSEGYTGAFCVPDIFSVDGNGHGTNILVSGQSAIDPGQSWHTYRFELKDNHLTLYYDGAEMVSVIDNHDLDAGRVGLQVSGMQVTVRSFKVIAL